MKGLPDKQQTIEAKAESEKLEEELKETWSTAQATEETKEEEKEAGPEVTEDPEVSKEASKNKIFLVVVLLAALGGCGFWLVKKLMKSKGTKENRNAPDVDDFSEEQLDIPVDTEAEERG